MISKPFFFEVLQMGEMEKYSHNIIWNTIGYTKGYIRKCSEVNSKFNQIGDTVPCKVLCGM